MDSAPPRVFLTLVTHEGQLARVFLRKHIAIRTVAADLNHDLAKLVNGKVVSQLRRKQHKLN